MKLSTGFLAFSIKFLQDKLLFIFELTALATWFGERNQCAIQGYVAITFLSFRIVDSFGFFIGFRNTWKGAILNSDGGEKVLDSLILMLKAGWDVKIDRFMVIVIIKMLIPCTNACFFMRDLVWCKINYGLIVGEKGFVIKELGGEL